MKEFQRMAEAVAEASKICSEWQIYGKKEAISRDDALRRGREFDAAMPEGVKRIYVCSSEGAVGVTEKYEFEIQWILLPLPGLQRGSRQGSDSW